MKFSKNKSEMGGRRERGFAHSNDRGNNLFFVEIPKMTGSIAQC